MAFSSHTMIMKPMKHICQEDITLCQQCDCSHPCHGILLKTLLHEPSFDYVFYRDAADAIFTKISYFATPLNEKLQVYVAPYLYVKILSYPIELYPNLFLLEAINYERSVPRNFLNMLN